MKPLSLLTLLAISSLSVSAQSETKKELTPSDASAAAGETKAEETSARTSTGITFSVAEEELLLTPENVKIPLNFVRTSVTPLVDEVGKTVPWEQVKAGLPATVEYIMLGEKMVATKVTVTRHMVDGGPATAASDDAGRKRAELAEIKMRKDSETAERVKTLPSTNGGTIMGFEQVIAVGTGNGADVTQYVVNNSTQFVDTAGKPVPLVFARTGARVEVRYVEDAGRKIATQFIVHRPATLAQQGTPPQPAAAGTASRPATTATTSDYSGAVATTVWMDQSGNIIPGTLEAGFLNPPLTMLPGATNGIANSNNVGNGVNNGSGVGNAGTTGNNTNGQGAAVGQPGVNTNQPNPVQPGATQPNTSQPNNTQPGNRQPSNRQPATRQPSTPPAGSNGSTPGRSTGGSPSAPASPGAAPGGR